VEIQMSMLGNVGAECAAQEILDYILIKIQTHKDDPVVVAALTKVADKARDIVNAARTGWY
jgi:hypothetical protein